MDMDDVPESIDDVSRALLDSLIISYKDLIMTKTRKERTIELTLALKTLVDEFRIHENKTTSLLAIRDAARRQLDDYELVSKRLAGELPA